MRNFSFSFMTNQLGIKHKLPSDVGVVTTMHLPDKT